MSELLHTFAPEAPRLGDIEAKRKQRLRHDLRQSLGTVMTLVEIVDHDLSRVPEVLRRLDQIRSETEWMSRMVAGDGPRAADRQLVDVGEVVADVWSAVAATSPCQMRLVRDAVASAVVDVVDLTRSVRNLLDNAVRASGEVGQVVVEVTGDADGVTISIRDSGPGFGNIPPQQGLGLLTVRRFAASIGGRLDVEHSPHGGAELRLRIPLPPVSPGGEHTCES